MIRSLTPDGLNSIRKPCPLSDVIMEHLPLMRILIKFPLSSDTMKASRIETIKEAEPSGYNSLCKYNYNLQLQKGQTHGQNVVARGGWLF